MTQQQPFLAGIIPAFGRIRSYEPKWLRADLIAGLTLAASLLPAGIGDASLAGLPPQAGIYACLFSGLVFWLFCSSRHTAITVTSAISLLVGSSLASFRTVAQTVAEFENEAQNPTHAASPNPH